MYHLKYALARGRSARRCDSLHRTYRSCGSLTGDATEPTERGIPADHRLLLRGGAERCVTPKEAIRDLALTGMLAFPT